MRDETNFNRPADISSLELEARDRVGQTSSNTKVEPHSAERLGTDEETPSRLGDSVLEEYPRQDVDRVHADAALSGSGTAFLNPAQPSASAEAEAEADAPLEDVPDADEIQANSPVDPAAPPVDHMHGTDLLNGSNGDNVAYEEHEES